MLSLDHLDYRIVRLLQEDARMSSRDMTRRLGDVSDRVVRYRIKRLLDCQVLFLQAMVDPRQVGYPVIADILVEVVPWKLAEGCAKLAAIEAVASVNAASDGGRLSIQVNARDKRELMTFVNSTLPQVDGIVSAQTMVVPLLAKDLAFWKPPAATALEQRQAHRHSSTAAPGWRQPLTAREASALSPDAAHEAARRSSVGSVSRSVGRQPDAHCEDAGRATTSLLDVLDRQIMKLLREDPRMSSCDMARRLGDVSDRVVRYRIKRLLDRGVVLVQARVNPHAVGYPVIADILIEVMPWKLAAACAKLVAMDPVCYVSTAHAGRDGRELSVEVNARNIGELAAFVKSALPRIDGIVSARTMVVPHLAKDVADWVIPRQL
jgi:DNA-binding Lrp family transcriptional regulator